MIQPRADILMFFTARKGTSYVHPGVTSNLQQVVYGHAELGEYVWKDDKYDFQPGVTAFPDQKDYPSPTAVSRVPAEQWHLARRGVLLLPTNPDPQNRPPDLGDPSILRSENDVVEGFNLLQHAQTPWSDSP